MVKHTSWHPPGNVAILKTEYAAAFREWCEKPIGKHFIALEKKRLDEIIPTLFGYDALLIGEPTFAQFMQQSKIKNQFVLNDDLSFAPKDTAGFIYARRDRLPIGSTIMDVVHLAHSLEFASSPHEVLREAYRILRADGHLVISMFNPISMWGVWRSTAKFSHNVLWKANFMSLAKLKDWLALLGFDIIRVNYFGYNLPLSKCNYSTNLSLLERYGQKFELPIGAAYIIEAAKRVIPLTPIANTWRTAPELNEDDVTEPTA